MKKNYKVITLCGSTKFKEQFTDVQKQLTLEGNIVLSPFIFSNTSADKDDITPEQKQLLIDMQKCKIDMSDEIFVVNVDGYIGMDTETEIEYAKQNAKRIKYLVKPAKESINKDSMIGKQVRHKYNNTIHTITDVTVFDEDTFGQGHFAVMTSDNQYLYECEIEML